MGLGALLLLVSLFLDWYEPDVTAWEAFEVLDLLMAALALAALVAAAGAFRPPPTIDRRSLPLIVAAMADRRLADPRPAAGVIGDPDHRAPGSRSAPRSSCAWARC